MIETDVQSRQRLFLMGSFLLLLFGGFAIFGVVSRAIEHKNFGSGIEDAAPALPDQAARLAERKRLFAVRKVMSEAGKQGDWRKAIAAADAFLATVDNTPVQMFRAEALWHSGSPSGGTEIAKIVKQRGEVSDGEAALITGDLSTYRRSCAELLQKTNEKAASELALNNIAWQCSLSSNAISPTEMTTAVRYAERSVALTRNSENPIVASSLPTYLNTLGGVYVRAGRSQEAITTLMESERLKHEPFNYPFLALAYHNLNKPVEAKKWRDRLHQYVFDTYAKRDGQGYRHELLLLYREVENTVK